MIEGKELKLVTEILTALGVRANSSMRSMDFGTIVSSIAKLSNSKSNGHIVGSPGYEKLVALAESRKFSDKIYFSQDTLSQADLKQIQVESSNIQLKRYDSYSAADAEPDSLARRFAESTQLSNTISSFFQRPLIHSGECAYMYYDRQGDGRHPHIDNDKHVVNCLLTLKVKNSQSGLSSAFCAYEKERTLNYYFVEGSMLAFNASARLHNRTNLNKEESMLLLTIGFIPKPQAGV